MENMFIIAVLIVFVSVLFFKGVKIFNYIDHVAGIMEMIPGPTPYPFVGNLFQFGLRPEEYPKKILQYCRKYEFKGFRSLVFFQYHVMLSDPAEIQNMLSSMALLHKEHLYTFLRPWLGDGLLTSSGARWLKHQKIYAPAFQPSIIAGYLKTVQTVGERLVRKLAQVDEDVICDIQSLGQKCTLDIVCENATGLCCNSLNDEPSQFQAAITQLCDIIQERAFSIVKRFDTLFQLTPQYWRQRRALQLLKCEVDRIVEKRQQQEKSENNPKMKKSFLDTLLSAQLDGRSLKSEEIFEELSTFIFTGHNPVAAAMSFTLYTISRHSHVQAKVYDEQRSIFGNITSSELCEVSSVSKEQLEMMEYLELVIRETLRLYPSVPLIARTNRKPIEINGTKIAKRTTVIMCLIAMGYNENYFDEPCEFRPERLRDAASVSSAGIDAYKSVPFSAGPRRCIAEKYAMYELKALISQIIRNFEILPPREGLPPGINDHSRLDCQPQSEFDPILNIRMTLKSENGIQVKLKNRQTRK